MKWRDARELGRELSGFVPAFGSEHSIPVSKGGAFEDFFHRLQLHRPGLERVVARAGVGTFIGCMAPAVGKIARDLAVDFYSHLLAGQPMAQALFLAKSARPADDDGTTLLFAMAGYPDTRIAAEPAG